MRLRYLHLPCCGPLTDAAVVFGREELVSHALNLPRIGALNFVVGINGTGKSSLLRALYRTFRALHFRDWPPLPETSATRQSSGPPAVSIRKPAPSLSVSHLLNAVTSCRSAPVWSSVALAGASAGTTYKTWSCAPLTSSG